MRHPNRIPKDVSSLGPAIRAAYRAGQEDEALEPIIKVDAFGKPLGRIGSGDAVIFYDIRGEREIEITRSLTDPDFSRFPAAKGLNLHFVTMIEYDPSLRADVAFAQDEKVANTLAEVLSSSGLRLAKIAESEKAAHIGFFMNGKSDTVFPGEERIIVPSPEGVFNYDQKPEMSAASVADEILRKMGDPQVRVVIANFANVDVVGHIENRPAVARAVETVDGQLGRVVSEADRRRVTLIVTADHGTVEEWLYPDGLVNTGHTKNPVPFVLADFSPDRPAAIDLRPSGELADVAPTVLDLLGLPAPIEMTGRSLLAERPDRPTKRGKIVLLILDGWGMRNDWEGNLIAQSRTPNFDALWTRFPHALLESSGEAVGLPPGTVGNSEAGHLHLGAGRRILLDRVRIDRAVEDRSFFSNEAFLRALRTAMERRRALHLMGIISHYSSHGTIKHLFALLKLARDAGLSEVYVHGFIGRRGEKPESGAIYVEKVEDMCRSLGVGEVVTVLGRYWALDREENWDRVEKAYRALVYGEGTPAGNFSDQNT
ncbi:MAG: alkaline phosphatase family protein [Candidatus Aminicenantes bacterium]|nr:alkaline phosphatase family protein [Candidatus Aminicenantes bacterium]